MVARLSAFVLWALVAASVVFWALRLLVSAPSAPPYAVPVGDATAIRGDLTRLLGSAPVAAAAPVVSPEASSRFRLLGIMAPKGTAGTAQGVALIAVDGKMAKAYPVGAQLDTNLVLQSVSLRTASIGPTAGTPAITLELPPPVAAATGRLPSGGGAAGQGTVPPPPVVVPQITPQIVPQLAPPSGVPPAPNDLTPVRPDPGSPTR